MWNQSSDIAILRNNGKSEAFVADLAKIPEFSLLHIFAAFCSNVYQDDETESTTSFAKFCDSENIEYLPEGWVKIPSLPGIPETPKNRFKVRGLKYLAWSKTLPGNITQVVIAFRGTDPAQLGDWFSNFRWVTRFIPFLWDQYDQTRVLIPNVIKYVNQLYGNDVDVIVTGHSLGGGLAHQAAYASGIKKVYAFNPSSVTGYYSVNKKDRDDNVKGMTVYRIYEHGEVLAFVRLFMKGLYPISQVNPKIIELRYNLLNGNMISQHSIKKFACELYKLSTDIQK